MAEGRDRRGAGLLDYLKAAFLFRWNLLFFLGAAATALISPRADVLLPLVGAAEMTYLAGLVSLPRFRAAIDARKEAERSRGVSSVAGGIGGRQALEDLLAGLDDGRRGRFLALRDRALSMRSLARGARGTAGRGGAGGAEDINTPALDRLLWVFLRLLHSQQALERFLAATEEEDLSGKLESLERHRDSLAKGGDERIRRSLDDSIATTRLRLENYRKAKGNAAFADVETDRIEGKIEALTEMAVSHQDPDTLSRQVDSVAESMKQTENAIRELNEITGLTEDLGEPPPILESRLTVSQEG